MTSFFVIYLFRSNILYYSLPQQSALQQPVYLAPTGATTAATWPPNIFSQFNIANLSNATPTNTNVSNALNTTNTTSPQTVYEVSSNLFDTTAPTNGQQLFWPNYG